MREDDDEYDDSKILVVIVCVGNLPGNLLRTQNVNKPLSSVSATKAAHLYSDKIHNKQTAELDGSSALHTEQSAVSPHGKDLCSVWIQIPI